MATPAEHSQPNPENIFDTLNAHQKTAALKTGIELDVFSAIGEGANTPAALAKRCNASERGMRTLCDFLTILGFLTKQDQKYSLAPDTATFLDRRSPAYIGSIAGFLTTPEMFDRFRDLTAIVRKGGSLQDDRGTTEVNNPIWVEFARSMAPMQRPVAEGVAKLVNADAGEKWKVLDIAAGHGVYGVAIARHNPNAEIFAVDWPAVLEVAKENARAAKVDSRYHTIPGNAFEVDFGTGYDLVLVTGFLHHFDPPDDRKVDAEDSCGACAERPRGDRGIRAERGSRDAGYRSGFQLDHAGGNARGRFLSDVRVRSHISKCRFFVE